MARRKARKTPKKKRQSMFRKVLALGIGGAAVKGAATAIGGYLAKKVAGI